MKTQFIEKRGFYMNIGLEIICERQQKLLSVKLFTHISQPFNGTIA